MGISAWVNFDGFVKSKISPSRLGVTGGDEPCTIWYRVKGRGITNLVKFLVFSPSPLPCGVVKLTPQGKPSPVKGEGIFLIFYEIINFQLYNSFQNPYTQVDHEVTLIGEASSAEGEGPRPKDL
jgi:hypothetical protein